MDFCLSQRHQREVKREQIRPEFEIGSQTLFPMAITIALSAPPKFR